MCCSFSYTLTLCAKENSMDVYLCHPGFVLDANVTLVVADMFWTTRNLQVTFTPS